MSSTVQAPFGSLGKNGDYAIEINYGVRIYDSKGEKIPKVGGVGATPKGGLRTNFIGPVPLLDGKKEKIGLTEVTQIISAKPENMQMKHLRACGFKTKKEALIYVKREHGEEFSRDGVVTVFYFKVLKRK